MADLTELTALARERYETGAHGDAHLRLAPNTWQEMRRATPPAPPKPLPWLGDPLGNLLSIPIVVDEGLPPGTWLLVDTISGDVRQEGRIEAGHEYPGGEDG